MVSAQELDTIKIGAAFPGYVGMQPSAINGEKNPALNLETGKKYEVVLQRLDPYNHNIVFINEETNKVQERMPQYTSDETPKIRRMEITATEGMTRYYCDVHPTMMNGPVNFDGGFGFQPATDESNSVEASGSTPTEQMTQTETAAMTQNPQTVAAQTENTATDEVSGQAPGFGVVSALAGLTAAAGGWRYLDRRGNE